ncbi:phospholipase D-like domain-containing protein [Porifericola rhodea]|uniref:phospholipase D-like domain-containing protein n=1 Tax=Porifericola rhodea TaxID=930972 RepID=UPI002665F704|nr:phospholipase D-like domain-containing protein [Porifericola rhodea]WKN32489.1 phospholipase D-like domain-containing protein [Porifericola rhodea]
MFGSNGTIDQQIIYTREEIYVRLKQELAEARSEILIAAERFTHQELYQLLKERLSAGLKVEIIVENYDRDNSPTLNQLMLQGASVLSLPSEGNELLPQKFCIVDKKLAIYGSYEWYLQESWTSQQESIMLSHHQPTVNGLLDEFTSLKNKAFRLEGAKKPLLHQLRAFFGLRPARQLKDSSPRLSENAVQPIVAAKDKYEDYEQVLDSMIAAEVSNFDRELVRRQGYERAQANNGDAQVLHKALDSVYSVFVNEINLVEGKKNRLLSKIEEQRIKSTEKLKEQQSLQLSTLEAQCDARGEGLRHKVTKLESQIAVHEKEIEGIRQHKIPALEDKKQQIDYQIKAQEREHIKPAFKWFEFIPVVFINLGLLFYLFFFYSSAAYILLFSELDAKEARLRGITVNPPEVFNPEAIAMATEKGGSALLFITLFVFVPLSLALIGRFVKDLKWWGSALMILGIILVDAFIAYKVAEAIHNVDYLTGNVDVLWEFPMAFEDLNFYLVFILGALGLMLFKITFEKLMRFFEERNPDLNAQRNRQHIRHLEEEAARQQQHKLEQEEEIARIEKEIIALKAEINICTEEISKLPAHKTQQAENKKMEIARQMQAVERITDVYKTHLENDILPISVDSVKDRINVFLEGWNDYLHSEYAVKRAIEKSQAAAEVASRWQSEKLSAKRYDQRIKT